MTPSRRPAGIEHLLVVRKAFAYVTHNNRLLIFSHPLEPEAGLQVPAGTMHDGETPEHAVLREAAEETGLEGLRIVRFLGEAWQDARPAGRDELHHRYFFHLACDSDPPERWQQYELDTSDGTPPPLFELWWVPLPNGVPELIAGHDALLPTLIDSL